MKKQQFLTGLMLVSLLLIAAVSRIIPHPYNFAPTAALLLFGAAYFKNRLLAIGLPLLSVFLGDLYLNHFVYTASDLGNSWFYEGWAFVYATYVLTGLLAMPLLKKITAGRVVIGSLSSSLLFYLITNFTSWPGNPLYTQDVSGLIHCMAAGIPFLKNALPGNLIYAALLFGMAELGLHFLRKPAFAKVRA